MTSAAYLPILIQVILATGVGLAILTVNRVLAQRVRTKNAIKTPPMSAA